MENNTFRPSVRYIKDIEIYFKNKYVVQVRQNSTIIDIVRWNKPGGGRYKTDWLPFCSKLCKLNSIDSIYQIMRIASRYDLYIIKSRHPEQPPPDIWVRPEKYKWPRKKGKHGNIQTNKNKR